MSVAAIARRVLRIPTLVPLLYNWKRKFLKQGGPAAEGLEARVRQLEQELKRVERERDILSRLSARWRSTASAIVGRDE